MNVSFDNTEIAFKHKSTSDLLKAKRLFQLFSYPFLVEKGPLLANFGLKIGLPIKGIIRNTVFHQFCGGEDIHSSYNSAKELYNNGIGAILDYSVEGAGNEKSYQRVYNELVELINNATGNPVFPFIVFKCTGLGPIDLMEKASNNFSLSEKESIQYNKFKERVELLCKLCYEKNVQLFIDAEESWIQGAIDVLCYSMMAKYNKKSAIVFNTIQLYRKSRVEAMEKQIQAARDKQYYIGFKIVRGAYLEKETERALEMSYENPIQNSKLDTDNDYNRAIELCFENRDVVSVCAGTHNEESSYLLANLIADNGIDKKDNRFWFAQLYGMSDHISFNLSKAGFNVAKYLPYGPVKDVLPYLARRAKENSSVKGQVGRELSLINKELSRRKN